MSAVPPVPVAANPTMCSCESYDCQGECCGPGQCSCTPADVPPVSVAANPTIGEALCADDIHEADGSCGHTPTVDLDAIRARVDAAAPGPWFTGARGLHPWEVCVDWNRPQIEMEDTRQGVADADFIANARQDIPALLAEVERLRDELGRAVDDVMARGFDRVADQMDRDAR